MQAFFYFVFTKFYVFNTKENDLKLDLFKNKMLD